MTRRRGSVGVAVIGAGHWGPNLIRNFSEHNASSVRWVVDVSDERRAQVAARYPGVRTGDDAAEAISAPNVDAVVVATPSSTHFELAMAALRAGKHVLVEKPITTDTRDAERLCDVADDEGLVLMVGHVFVYNAAVQRVKNYIERGELGDLKYIAALRTNLGPIRMDVSAAWDLAAHDISITNFWLDAEPVAASAVGGIWINEGVQDAVFATLRYPRDVLVNLHVSWLNPRKTRHITVVGDRKMLTFDDMQLTEPIRIYDKGVRDETMTPSFVDTFASFRASVREGDITIPKVAVGEPLREECDHFIECIVSGSKPLTDGRSGLAVVRALEAIETSMEAGGHEQSIA